MQPVRASHPVQRLRSASHPVQRPRIALRGPRIASRTTTAQRIAQMQPVRRGPRIVSRTTTAHRPPRSAHRPSRSAHASQYFALVSFRLVRGTNFSKIPYRYIFIPDIFMAHPSYWLRCENLICGPRFDSGTRRVIVVGPRRRPCCNDDFTTADSVTCLSLPNSLSGPRRRPCCMTARIPQFVPLHLRTTRLKNRALVFLSHVTLFVGEERTLFIKNT
jgi:hypothetical protein